MQVIPSLATRTIHDEGIDASHLVLYRFSPMILATHARTFASGTYPSQPIRSLHINIIE